MQVEQLETTQVERCLGGTQLKLQIDWRRPRQQEPHLALHLAPEARADAMRLGLGADNQEPFVRIVSMQRRSVRFVVPERHRIQDRRTRGSDLDSPSAVLHTNMV